MYQRQGFRNQASQGERSTLLVPERGWSKRLLGLGFKASMKHQFHVDGGSIPIEDGMTLGRSAECDFQLTAQGVSRQHARLSIDGDAVIIHDLGSSNGVRVNKQKIDTQAALADGDVVMIGRAELTYGNGSGGAKRDEDTKRIRASKDPNTLIDQLVAGHRISALIGRSKHGATYEAKQLRLDRKVAFKAFWSDLAAKDPTAADRIMGKVKQAAAISDPSIAQLHECGREDDLLWYTSELVDGDELTELMARDGKIPVELALLVAERTARGLQAAHEQGVVHGDIRPAAIRITRSGNIKVMDLGLDALRRALKGGVPSSAAHTAPEVGDGEDPSVSSDIYSLGATLFHLLCGRPPYTATDPKKLLAAHHDEPIPVASELRKGLPAQVDELIHGMLAKRPDWRFGSMQELIGDLTKLREAASRGELNVAEPERPAAATAPKPGTRAKGSEVRQRSSEVRDRRRGGKKPPIAQLVVVAGAVVLVLVFLPQIKQLLAQASEAEGIPIGQVDDPPPADPTPTDPVPVDPPSDPVTTPSDPPPVEPLVDPVGDPLRAEWTTLTATIADDVAAERWGEAERALERFRRKAERTDGSSLDSAAASRLRTLGLDADRWFQQAVNELPFGEGAELKQRLVALDRIRRQVARANRTSAETMYQQTAERLRRQLALARQEALRALETGELQRLPTIAAGLEPIFADTPLADEQRHFATAAKEASQLAWNVDWTSTRQRFDTARGEQALAAAGAQLLLQENGAAAGILLGDRDLEPLAERRDALLAATSRRLRFESPADLGEIAIRLGEPTLGDDGLTGTPGEPIGIGLNERLGRSWQVGLVLSLRPSGGSDANATVAVTGDAGPLVSINLQALARGGEARAVAGTATGRQLVGNFRQLKIDLACADGQVSARINGRELLAPTAIAAAAGAQVTLDLADATWTLHEVGVVGAR